MNWKEELKVGDKFLYKDLSHYAIITAIDSGYISWTWYYIDTRKVAGTPTISTEHFYSINFISPMSPLLETLLWA